MAEEMAARIMQELKSKNGEVRHNAARSLRQLLLRCSSPLGSSPSPASELSSRLLSDVQKCIFDLIHSTDATDKLTGIEAMDALMDVKSGYGVGGLGEGGIMMGQSFSAEENETKNIRFAHYLRMILQQTGGGSSSGSGSGTTAGAAGASGTSGGGIGGTGIGGSSGGSGTGSSSAPLSSSSALSSDDRLHLEFRLLSAAASALGHLARVGGTFSSDIVEFQINQSLEWLEGDRGESRRFAAVTVLRELASNTPTLFNVHIGRFLDKVWTALRDRSLVVREAAAAALRCCIQLIAKRAMRLRSQRYGLVYAEVMRSFKLTPSILTQTAAQAIASVGNSMATARAAAIIHAHTTSLVSTPYSVPNVESIHGGLLILHELLRCSGEFLRGSGSGAVGTMTEGGGSTSPSSSSQPLPSTRYRDCIEMVLRFKDLTIKGERSIESHGTAASTPGSPAFLQLHSSHSRLVRDSIVALLPKLVSFDWEACSRMGYFDCMFFHVLVNTRISVMGSGGYAANSPSLSAAASALGLNPSSMVSWQPSSGSSASAPHPISREIGFLSLGDLVVLGSKRLASNASNHRIIEVIMEVIREGVLLGSSASHTTPGGTHPVTSSRFSTLRVGGGSAATPSTPQHTFCNESLNCLASLSVAFGIRLLPFLSSELVEQLFVGGLTPALIECVLAMCTNLNRDPLGNVWNSSGSSSSSSSTPTSSASNRSRTSSASRNNNPPTPTGAVHPLPPHQSTSPSSSANGKYPSSPSTTASSLTSTIISASGLPVGRVIALLQEKLLHRISCVLLAVMQNPSAAALTPGAGSHSSGSGISSGGSSSSSSSSFSSISPVVHALVGPFAVGLGFGSSIDASSSDGRRKLGRVGMGSRSGVGSVSVTAASSGNFAPVPAAVGPPKRRPSTLAAFGGILTTPARTIMSVGSGSSPSLPSPSSDASSSLAFDLLLLSLHTLASFPFTNHTLLSVVRDLNLVALLDFHHPKIRRVASVTIAKILCKTKGENEERVMRSLLDNQRAHVVLNAQQSIAVPQPQHASKSSGGNANVSAGIAASLAGFAPPTLQSAGGSSAPTPASFFTPSSSSDSNSSASLDVLTSASFFTASFSPLQISTIISCLDRLLISALSDPVVSNRRAILSVLLRGDGDGEGVAGCGLFGHEDGDDGHDNMDGINLTESMLDDSDDFDSDGSCSSSSAADGFTSSNNPLLDCWSLPPSRHRLDDLFLHTPGFIHQLFLMLNDENLGVRRVACSIIGRIGVRSPALVMPSLRKVLMQLLTEINHGADARTREESCLLLGHLLRSAKMLLLPYVETILQVLIPKLRSCIPLTHSGLDRSGNHVGGSRSNSTREGGRTPSLSSLHADLRVCNCLLDALSKLALIGGHVLAMPPGATTNGLEDYGEGGDALVAWNEGETFNTPKYASSSATSTTPHPQSYLMQLLPLIFHLLSLNPSSTSGNLRQASSVLRKDVVLRTLSSLLTATGFVVEPYFRYPGLLKILLGLLQSTAGGRKGEAVVNHVRGGSSAPVDGADSGLIGAGMVGGRGSMLSSVPSASASSAYLVRREVLKLLGVLGALDPYVYREILDASSRGFLIVPVKSFNRGMAGAGATMPSQDIPTANNQQGQQRGGGATKDALPSLPGGGSLSSSLSQLSDDYYPTVALQGLLKILRDPSLGTHHSQVLKAIMFIVRSLGSSTKCAKYLPMIVPTFIQVLKQTSFNPPTATSGANATTSNNAAGRGGTSSKSSSNTSSASSSGSGGSASNVSGETDFDFSLRDALFIQLGHLISVVRHQIKPYLQGIFELITYGWGGVGPSVGAGGHGSGGVVGGGSSVTPSTLVDASTSVPATNVGSGGASGSVSSVPQHVSETWTTHILILINKIVLALRDEFKVYLPTLVPALLHLLHTDRSFERHMTLKILHTFNVINQQYFTPQSRSTAAAASVTIGGGSSGSRPPAPHPLSGLSFSSMSSRASIVGSQWTTDYLYLVLPSFIRLAEQPESNLIVKQAAIASIASIARILNLHEYAGRLMLPLARLLELPDPPPIVPTSKSSKEVVTTTATPGSSSPAAAHIASTLATLTAPPTGTRSSSAARTIDLHSLLHPSSLAPLREDILQLLCLLLFQFQTAAINFLPMFSRILNQPGWVDKHLGGGLHHSLSAGHGGTHSSSSSSKNEPPSSGLKQPAFIEAILIAHAGSAHTAGMIQAPPPITHTYLERFELLVAKLSHFQRIYPHDLDGIKLGLKCFQGFGCTGLAGSILAIAPTFGLNLAAMGGASVVAGLGGLGGLGMNGPGSHGMSAAGACGVGGTSGKDGNMVAAGTASTGLVGATPALAAAGLTIGGVGATSNGSFANDDSSFDSNSSFDSDWGVGVGVGLGFGFGFGVGANHGNAPPPKKLQVSEANLQKVWEVSQRSTKDDWIEWMRSFSIELLKESPSPALRSCSILAQKYHPLARELFHASFVSCWNELQDRYQDDLIRCIDSAFHATNLPSEVLHALLNLVELMERDGKSMPFDGRMLGKLAQSVHAYAKALYYAEKEVDLDPARAAAATAQGLIAIHNQLGNPEAALGILAYNKKIEQQRLREQSIARATGGLTGLASTTAGSTNLALSPEDSSTSSFHIQVGWYEKLQKWEEALESYERKQIENPETVDYTLGRMRCLKALGEWERLYTLTETTWSRLGLDHGGSNGNGLSGDGILATATLAGPDESEAIRREIAPLACMAAWNLGAWSSMSKFVTSLDHSHAEHELLRCIAALYMDDLGEAWRSIERGRAMLDAELGALMSESYARAYPVLVQVQQFGEMAEITRLKQSIMQQQAKGGQIGWLHATGYDAHTNKRGMNNLNPFIGRERIQQHGAPLLPSSYVPPLLRRMWSQRLLHGAARSVDVWQNVLLVRRLVLSPQEDMDTWLRFDSLCRKSGKLSLSLQVLTTLLGFDPQQWHREAETTNDASNGNGNLAPFPTDFPAVTYAYLKHLWKAGEDAAGIEMKIEALTRLQQLSTQLEAYTTSRSGAGGGGYAAHTAAASQNAGSWDELLGNRRHSIDIGADGTLHITRPSRAPSMSISVSPPTSFGGAAQSGSRPGSPVRARTARQSSMSGSLPTFTGVNSSPPVASSTAPSSSSSSSFDPLSSPFHLSNLSSSQLHRLKARIYLKLGLWHLSLTAFTHDTAAAGGTASSNSSASINVAPGTSVIVNGAGENGTATGPIRIIGFGPAESSKASAAAKRRSASKLKQRRSLGMSSNNAAAGSSSSTTTADNFTFGEDNIPRIMHYFRRATEEAAYMDGGATLPTAGSASYGGGYATQSGGVYGSEMGMNPGVSSPHTSDIADAQGLDALTSPVSSPYASQSGMPGSFGYGSASGGMGMGGTSLQSTRSIPGPFPSSAAADPSFDEVESSGGQATASRDTTRKLYKVWHNWAVINFRLVQHYKQKKQQLMDARKNTNAHSVSATTTATMNGTNGSSSSAAAASPILAEESYQSALASLDAQIRQHVIPAIRGFFKSISLAGESHSFQDILRLLTLWFAHGMDAEVASELHVGFHGGALSIDTWLCVIPQIIARIDAPAATVRQSIFQLLCKIGLKHAQALVYPLAVVSKSSSRVRQKCALKLLNVIQTHEAQLVDQALMVSRELIRVSILWSEMWHEALEEASRLWFGPSRNFEAMMSILSPLRRMMERGASTLQEISFMHSFGRDFQESFEWMDKFLSSGNDSDVNQAWDILVGCFRRINKQLTSQSDLELQFVSPTLLHAHSLVLAMPGTFLADRDCADRSRVRIAFFVPTLKVIESKQRPRKLSIMGDDGREYTFLLKGHEDLRQDKRVMQLFGLVNTLLQADSETNRKDLKIRGYAVIPLAPNSGLIQWLHNCDTLHALIKEYRDARKVLLNIEHRLMLQMAPDHALLPLMQKVEVFEHALSRTTGADLANVLWLSASSSEVWLDRRTNYTRSLAVMCMVGYILGLGDRHPCNLMLDRSSGKILHIDFGDCFEVAMQRDKFPEKIPFRLTRMLVNAMEVSGIEGTFRATAHSVMRVLRENKESVMAVLEAFVYDPLINWRLVTAPKKQTMHGDETTGATAAAVTVAVAAAAAGTDVDKTVGAGAETDVTVPNGVAAAAIATGQNPLGPTVGAGASKVSTTPPSQAPGPDATAVNGVGGAPDAGGSGSGGLPASAPEDAGSEVLNAKALSVIARVESKLLGRDFDPNVVLDTAEQVEQLIQQATSHTNLCQCYIGWCPFW